jgi:hypothetical protein
MYQRMNIFLILILIPAAENCGFFFLWRGQHYTAKVPTDYLQLARSPCRHVWLNLVSGGNDVVSSCTVQVTSQLTSTCLIIYWPAFSQSWLPQSINYYITNKTLRIQEN